MPGIDIWPVVHDERSALAADLASLSEQQWTTPSLCSDWTVQDVLAPMTATAKVTPTTFFPKLIELRLQFRPDAGEGHRRREGRLRRGDAVALRERDRVGEPPAGAEGHDPRWDHTMNRQ